MERIQRKAEIQTKEYLSLLGYIKSMSTTQRKKGMKRNGKSR